MSLRYFAIVCCLLCQSRAAETELAGPTLGFLFDPSNGLQSIRGISGALTVGAPSELPPGIAKMVISPQQDYALAVTGSDSTVLKTGMGDALSVDQLGIPVAGTDMIALSPSGSAAAFYDRGSNRVQVIAGLPAQPALAREFDLSAFPGTLAALAVNDSADLVVAGFSGVEQDAAVALGVDGTVRTLPGPQNVSAIGFFRGSRDFLIADGPASKVYLVKDTAGTSETTLLADETSGISGPVAVAASMDGKRVFVANSGSPGVASVDLAGGVVAVTSCRCAPTQLAAVNGNAVFRLSGPSGGPVWLFDGDGDEPRIVFVPQYRSAAEDGAK